MIRPYLYVLFIKPILKKVLILVYIGITLSFLGKHQEAILMYEIANYLNPFD